MIKEFQTGLTLSLQTVANGTTNRERHAISSILWYSCKLQRFKSSRLKSSYATCAKRKTSTSKRVTFHANSNVPSIVVQPVSIIRSNVSLTCIKCKCIPGSDNKFLKMWKILLCSWRKYLKTSTSWCILKIMKITNCHSISIKSIEIIAKRLKIKFAARRRQERIVTMSELTKN